MLYLSLSAEFRDVNRRVPRLTVCPSQWTKGSRGLPADVDREAIESIIAAAVELLNAEVRETLANRKDETHERV